MTKLNLWNEGDNVLLRGIFDNRPVYVQSLRVVRDTPEETVLFIWPGAECYAPKGYIQQGHNGNWDRWQETFSNTLNLEKYLWHTNRFLIILEPEKYLTNQRFDYIIINSVFHHLNDLSATRLTRNLAAYLNPEGSIIVVDHIYNEKLNYINKLLLKYDRGSYSRTEASFRKIFEDFIIVSYHEFFIRAGPLVLWSQCRLVLKGKNF